ncbi:MAG TPA: dodecin family protein [Thermodesulfobacteriota bacterium]|nr:dodecin family protein [Thermodesulfobacteriota bacterium]
MAVARITEVIGSSTKSWDDAVNNALKRANKTLRGLTGIEVTKMNAHIKDGKISEYRAHIKITFILEG